jgi:ABC-type transporter Mla subunit MlaD
MNSQVALTLSAPRLLRPLHTSFSDFKEDFDAALKNVTALSGSLTNKSSALASKLEPLKKIPNSAEGMSSEITDLLGKCKENDGLIEGMKSKALGSIMTSSKSVIDKLNEQIAESEKALRELDDLVGKNASESEVSASRLASQRQSLERSILALTTEIEKTTNGRIERLNEAIGVASRRTNETLEQLQDMVSHGFDGILNSDQKTTQPSFLAELQQAGYDAELTELIARMNALKERLDGGPEGEAEEEAPEVEVEDDETEDVPEVFTTMVDGVETEFFCCSDGTFHN